MLKIRNTYISLKDIRMIEHKTSSDYYSNTYHYIIITYKDEKTIKICIGNYKEYEELANLIASKIED